MLVALIALLTSSCGLFSSDPGATDATLPEPTLTPSPIESTGPSATSPSAAPDLSEFSGQRLAWKECRGNAECARLRVPLDYTKPQGRVITLSLLKRPAQNSKQRVGSLVVNPGGPGVPGVDMAAAAEAYLGPELLAAFDIVGFDPRGVGDSTPLDCLSDRQLDDFLGSDPDPDTPAEERAYLAAIERLGEGCLRRSGNLVRHMSTSDVARDLDVLRSALDEEKLAFFGFSYGTFMGATYAQQFPDRVGRMVLDGAIDPSLTTEQFALVQAKGFETALRAYVADCVAQEDCFLGGTVDAGAARVREFLDRVEVKALPGTQDRRLTAGTAMLGVWAPLYSRSLWPTLTAALKAGFADNGAPLLALADGYAQRGPNGYLNNLNEALNAVNCLDHDDPVPMSDVAGLLPRFEEVSPTFGRNFAYATTACQGFPVRSGRVPAPIAAQGAAPILVVGTTRDPATPVEWAEALANQLDAGVLIRRDGDGHTGYHAGNGCVDEAVESYLVSGTVPERNVDCPAEEQ